MATKIPVSDIVQALGGKENVAQAAHCATRLRVTPRDWSKISEDQLKAVPGVLGVVRGSTQVQVIIGAEVNNVYKEFVELTGVDEEDAIDENLDLKSELANKKGSLLTRFFETVAAIFNPIVPALAGCGFLSAFISIFMAFGASTSDPTFNVITSVSMAVFTFLPFLLAASAAKVFKMNQFVALTICAGMMSSTWSGLIAEGVETYTFLGIPFRVIDYSSSVLPIVFAILLASYVERFLDKYIPGALKIILVPALTILIATPVTLLTVGPLTYWIGEVLASGVNMLFEYGGVFAGLVYGGIYSAMVVLGIHHGMVPVLTQMIADQGFNYVSPTSGAANIGQAGAAFGVWLKTRDKALKGNVQAHASGEDPVVRPAGRALHNVGLLLLHAQGKGGEAVGNQVDPQKMHRL